MTSDLLSEEDMKEFDEDLEDSYDNEYADFYASTSNRAEKGDDDDIPYQPSRRPQFSSSNNNARKTRSSRRISSRSKAAAYEDKGILWPDGTPKYVYEHEKSMDTSIVFERYHKLEALEKDVLRQIREKEAHWPVCGRKFFPPDGSLPKSALRKLARNSGTIFAPYLLYSDKYEVGQPSFSHFWRRKILACKSCEEVNLQLSILESFINRDTIANIIQISETALKKKYTVDKVIELSQHDPMTGLVEFFVKDSNKNTGCWMPQHAIENSMLIQFLHTETTKHQQDFLEKVNTKDTIEQDKKNLEMEKRLVLEQVEESKKKMFLLKNSISVVEEGMFEKQKELDQNEESCLDLQKEVQRSKQEIDKLEDQAIKLRRAALQAQSAIAGSHHQLNQGFHTANNHQTSYSNQTNNNNNNTTSNNPFGHLLDPDSGRMDNMMNNNLHSSLNTLSNNNNNNSAASALVQQQAQQQLQQEESIYEDAFKSAVLAHRDATAALLKQSANIGLETVPADTISKERFKHMTEMKKANDKLLELGSSSHITEDELVNVLSDAESAGVQLYVNGAEDVAINNAAAASQQQAQAQVQALSSLTTNEDTHLNSRFMNGAAAAAKSNSHQMRLKNAGATHADSLFEKQVLSQLAQLDPSLIQGTTAGSEPVVGAQQQLQQHFASHAHAAAGLDHTHHNNNAFATTLSSALALSEANKNAGNMMHHHQLDSAFPDAYSTANTTNQLLMQSVAQAASGGTTHHGNQFDTSAADALMLGLSHHHHHAGNNAAHHNINLQNAFAGVGGGPNHHNPFASAAAAASHHHHHSLNHHTPHHHQLNQAQAAAQAAAHAAAAQGHQLFSNQHSSTQFPYNFTNSMNQGGDQNRNFGDFGF